MTTDDIRWQQRFSNYTKALDKLIEAVEYVQNEIEDEKSDSVLDDILKEGLIQRFEYTHELACNVMKDFLFEVGGIKIMGSFMALVLKATIGPDLIWTSRLKVIIWI
jgi:hypothetical protein